MNPPLHSIDPSRKPSVVTMMNSISLQHWSWLLAVCVVLISTGCGRKSAESKLHGVWKLASTDRLTERMFGTDDETDEVDTDDDATGGDGLANRVEIGERILSQALSLTVEFKRDGTLQTSTNVMGAKQVKTGTWSVARFEDDTVTVEFQLGDGDQRIDVRLIDDDTIEMIPPNLAVLGKGYRFTREE